MKKETKKKLMLGGGILVLGAAVGLLAGKAVQDRKRTKLRNVIDDIKKNDYDAWKEKFFEASKDNFKSLSDDELKEMADKFSEVKRKMKEEISKNGVVSRSVLNDYDLVQSKRVRVKTEYRNRLLSNPKIKQKVNRSQEPGLD